MCTLTMPHTCIMTLQAITGNCLPSGAKGLLGALVAAGDTGAAPELAAPLLQGNKFGGDVTQHLHEHFDSGLVQQLASLPAPDLDPAIDKVLAFRAACSDGAVPDRVPPEVLVAMWRSMDDVFDAVAAGDPSSWTASMDGIRPAWKVPRYVCHARRCECGPHSPHGPTAPCTTHTQAASM